MYVRFLGQYRTKIVRQMRRQIFRQMKQKAEWILDVFTSIFVKYDGKFASRWRAKSPDALCAVLPQAFSGILFTWIEKSPNSPWLVLSVFDLQFPVAGLFLYGCWKNGRKTKKTLRNEVPFSWRGRRDLNPRAGFPTYSLSRGAPSPLGYFRILWSKGGNVMRNVPFRMYSTGGEGGIRTHGSLRNH